MYVSDDAASRNSGLTGSVTLAAVASIAARLGLLNCLNMVAVLCCAALRRYFAPALALNPHYAAAIRALFTRQSIPDNHSTTSSSSIPEAAQSQATMGDQPSLMATIRSYLPPDTPTGMPLSDLDMFGTLSPLLLRPIAPLRKQIAAFARKKLGVGSMSGSDVSSPPHTIGMQLRTRDRCAVFFSLCGVIG
jgi:lysozyme family protein